VLVERPSILLLRLSSLGDIVLTTALIAALRNRYPEGRIDLVIAREYESIVPALSGLDRVHIYIKKTGLAGLRALRGQLRKERYDYVLDLHNVLRTRILRRGLGRTTAVVNKRTFKRWLLVRFKYDLLQSAPDTIRRYFETARALDVQDNGGVPQLNVYHQRDPKRIAIAPGARHWNKRWPANYFRELSAQLLEAGYQITFYGSAAEREIIEEIRAQLPSGNHRSLAGNIDLTETAHSIGKCAVAITNDSGLLHIAEAVGTPVICLFGPTVKQFGFAPRNPQSIVLEVEGLYCRPCTAIGLDHCPEKHFRCMIEIEPKHVYSLLVTHHSLL
jgi:lipopolysaccharide heptosyltransferase II